jgi:5-methylcytosine-specific restriction endonuclease McrA
MDAATRRLVRARAEHRCEYCTVPQSALPLATFHVEHIKARQHGGSDDPDNLALACGYCNRQKGPNLTAIDPDTNDVVPVFNPRRDAHADHFAFRGIFIQGLTPTGRATVRLLAMNSPRQIKDRGDLP